MKILQILDDEPWGGCTAIVHAIVRALVLRGDDVWIIPPDEVTAHHFEKLGAHIVMPPRGLRSVVDGGLLLAPWLFLLCRRSATRTGFRPGRRRVAGSGKPSLPG